MQKKSANALPTRLQITFKKVMSFKKAYIMCMRVSATNPLVINL